MRLRVLVVAVALTGCAAPARLIWVNPNVDNQTAQAQAMQCEQYAAQVAPYRARTFAPRSSTTSFLYGERAAQYEAAAAECMERSGYQLREVR